MECHACACVGRLSLWLCSAGAHFLKRKRQLLQRAQSTEDAVTALMYTDTTPASVAVATAPTAAASGGAAGAGVGGGAASASVEEDTTMVDAEPEPTTGWTCSIAELLEKEKTSSSAIQLID